MISISGKLIPQLSDTNTSSSDTKQWFDYLLYNKSKINIQNISADMNCGNYNKVVVPLGKIANTVCLL